MIILLKLFLAHLVGDFLLQSKSWVADKEKKKIKSIKLYLHILLHGVLLLLFLWNWNLWVLVILLTIFHGFIDILKLYYQNENNKVQWFFKDQLLHLLSIIALYYIWLQPALHLDKIFQNPILWIYITALLFLSVATGIIIQMLMSNWSQQISDGEDKSLNNAGKYIGILERFFVFILIITAHWGSYWFSFGC